MGLLFIAVIVAIALFGRSVLTENSKVNPVSQLVFVSPSDPSTFNAPLNQSAFNIFGFINEGLLTQNGMTTELEPALAESWEISEDKRKIVFTLRKGLQWSDGAPLTADDVVFSYNNVYLNPKVPTGIRDILRVGDGYPSVRKIDDLHVEFTVPEPFAPFLRYAGGISILPKHALEKAVTTTDKNGDLALLTTWGTDTNPQEIVGAGYYRMTDYIPSQRVIFERNPYYWRKDESGNAQPYVEQIILQIIESDETQSIAFRSGELDSLEVRPEAFSLLKKEEKKGKYTIYNGGPASESRFFSLNLCKAKNAQGEPFVDPIKLKWFTDLRFRQAMAHAIDRDRMKNNIYRGLGVVQHSPIGVASPYYFSPEQGLKTYDYDPQKAKDLLLDAGFQYNEDGQLLDADNNLVRFNLLVKSEEKTRVDAAVQIQQDLQAIGVRADLQVLNFNTVIKNLRSRDWEAYVGGFGGGGIEPHSSFNIWYSGGTLHQFNQGQYPGEEPIQDWEVTDWEKEIDRLFQEGAGELDEAKRKEIYGKFQQVVAENVPFLYLVNALSLEAVRDRIQNIKFTSFGGAFWNLYELKAEAD
ncbi:MAG: ABC transporter substrate-binding protein [Cyanobacteria bacterium SBLK]|nr:ABC transporter substrate-binding protein [Cyanobacteria bacterium SBLK]